MKTQQDAAVFIKNCSGCRIFICCAKSRMNLWGAQSSGWKNFVHYTAETNSFLPQSWAAIIAILSTIAELSIGILLLLGFQIKEQQRTPLFSLYFSQ